MRRFLVGVLTAGLALAHQTGLLAASTRTTIPHPAEVDEASRLYWNDAQQLAKEELLLLDRLERSLPNSDVQRVRSLQGQLLLHISSVDRFLQSNYPEPSVFCASPTGEGVAGTDAVDLNQGQVYCALYSSSRTLDVLRRDLARQSGVAAVEILKPAKTALNIPQKPPAEQDLSFLNFPEGTIIGHGVHIKTTTFVPPVLAAVEDRIALVRASRMKLAQAQSAFPEGLRLSIPVSAQPISAERNSVGTAPQAANQPNELYADEAQPYSQFLQRPNTGIARVLPTEMYLAATVNLDRAGNPMLAASGRYPLAVLNQRSGQLSPRLAVRVTGGLFQLVPSGIDYGFMSDLGDVALEDVWVPSAQKSDSVPDLLKFFYSYHPPTTMEAVTAEQQRFAVGKSSIAGLSSVVSAQLNRTYIVRSLQFKLPELIATGRSLLPNEAKILKELLAMPSSDSLFAFRPVSRRSDGSYTVLWRLLMQFPDPQVNDLDRYVGTGEP